MDLPDSASFPVFSRRHPCDAAKLLGEIRHIIKPAGRSHIPDAHALLCKKELRLLNPFVNDVIRKRISRFLFKQMRQIIRGQIHGICQLLAAQILCQMLLDIPLHRRHSILLIQHGGHAALILVNRIKRPALKRIKGIADSLRGCHNHLCAKRCKCLRIFILHGGKAQLQEAVVERLQ